MEENDRHVLERKTKVYVYISHFLSAWGDRMWSFGVGLFLIELAPESLRVTAIYGFSSGGAVLLFGAVVGDWVDNTPRLKAARSALIIQNLSVVVCAVVVFFVFWYNAEIEHYWPNKGLLRLCHAIIIIIAIIANLSSIARKIAVEKDWLVEMCGSDKDLLATMSATMRCIDQTSLILAPAATGQVIAYANLGYGAVFIGAWNLFSVVVEYYLILKVYENVPALKNKMYKKRKDKGVETTEEKELLDVQEGKEITLVSKEKEVEGEIETEASKSHDDKLYISLDDSEEANKKSKDKEKMDTEDNTCKESCTKLLRTMFKSFITLYVGWKTYKSYDVAFAGLALACLFMTVLGFDNITVGYAYSQGLNESILGGLMAAGAVAGILGTILYPIIRRHLGLERTGLYGLASEIIALIACVVAVWAPGSPFDPFYLSRTDGGNQTSAMNLPNNISSISMVSYNSSTGAPLNASDGVFYNISAVNQTFNDLSSRNQTSPSEKSGPSSYLSVSLFLGGIIAARFGLWLSDLTISQLFLENVIETERGIVNGVQNSLNKLMDMMKFLLVILVPQPELFGFLILISFSFICIGWVFYAKYSYSARGHLLPHKMRCIDVQNINQQPEPNTNTSEA